MDKRRWLPRAPRADEIRRPWRRELRDYRQLYLLLLPFCLLFFFLYIVPILSSIGLSLTYYNMFGTPKFIGLRNYIDLFLNDDVFFIALRNTLLFAVITGPLSYLLCFFAGRRRGKNASCLTGSDGKCAAGKGALYKHVRRTGIFPGGIDGDTVVVTSGTGRVDPGSTK